MRIGFFAALFAGSALIASASPVPTPLDAYAMHRTMRDHHQGEADYHLFAAGHHASRAQSNAAKYRAAQRRFVSKSRATGAVLAITSSYTTTMYDKGILISASTNITRARLTFMLHIFLLASVGA
ncbi:SubName: Full=Uncharacterized protein {ECO:0000313/EMBL:CCA72903.1} [Serendipita indica DSM 11827]|uniref:Uncharacterized protein n=1 Tax=Serendipita indica (strain DSM 11827) TaxID=1109443 RepID=G4TNL0_SERID|nr:SubName: Full=Uncharacterized protein {ECO:0000313/EMBL:CCA72903.1} [Serendipita indica DSM 11827]CCA72903.1 hypothetical protein PIIN_06839 [Serendipita indica DSM 11827]